jgi:hypothetical protein
MTELKYIVTKANQRPISPTIFGGRPSAVGGLDFILPPELEAGEPPEARGLARDEVRLMVSYLADNRVVHTRFRDLPNYLTAGDLLVINTSGTLNAALNATRGDATCPAIRSCWSCWPRMAAWCAPMCAGRAAMRSWTRPHWTS